MTFLHPIHRVLVPISTVAALLLMPALRSARGQNPAGTPAAPTIPGVTMNGPFEYEAAPGSKFTIAMMNGQPGMIIEEVAGQRIQSMVANGRAEVITIQQNGAVLYVKGQQGKEALVNAASARANGALAFAAATSPGAAAPPPTAGAAPPPGFPPAAPLAATSPSVPPAAAPADGSTTAGVIRFDDAAHTITVPRPDGVTVTFVGEDVKIAGFQRLGYIVRHQKGSTGRFFERTLAHSNAAGGSLSGGGEEFLKEGGGIIYDSGMGTNSDMQTNSPVLKAKQLSQIAVDAVAEVRKIPGHENFTPPGYNTLKEISQYRLRSDGSR
jgi:hypothetical protein